MRYQNLISLMNYPIIFSEESEDIKGTISFDIEESETEEINNEYAIPFNLSINSPFLREQVEKNKARLSVSINCQETYFFQNYDVNPHSNDEAISDHL